MFVSNALTLLPLLKHGTHMGMISYLTLFMHNKVSDVDRPCPKFLRLLFQHDPGSSTGTQGVMKDGGKFVIKTDSFSLNIKYFGL